MSAMACWRARARPCGVVTASWVRAWSRAMRMVTVKDSWPGSMPGLAGGLVFHLAYRLAQGRERPQFLAGQVG